MKRKTERKTRLFLLILLILSLEDLKECNTKTIFLEDHDEHNSVTCENETVNLVCPVYHGLRITDAFWGRKDKTKCPAKQALNKERNANKSDTVLCTKGVNQEAILWRVRQVCENIGTCSIQTNSAFFGIQNDSLCPRIYKYLEMKFKCRKYDLETWDW